MRQADETAHTLLRFAKKCLGLSTSQRVRAQICREDIAELDQYERFAFPLGVSRIQPLGVRRAISLDQKIRQDIRVDDDHGGRQRFAQSRPAAMAVSMSPIVSGRRFLSRTGLGALTGGVSPDAAAMPASSSRATVSLSFWLRWTACIFTRRISSSGISRVVFMAHIPIKPYLCQPHPGDDQRIISSVTRRTSARSGA